MRRQKHPLSKYIRPTPIKKCSIIIIPAKRNIIACTQTSFGKTAVYLFTAINDMRKLGALQQPPSAKNSSVYRCTSYHIDLVLATTRELASQISFWMNQ
mmetsp:Transcript_581/g.1454  ORF Transcript_581/g.1454 Transcript_581/m.1454 type:complete len:99 (+) Transcript_581:52-348(+)